MTTRAGGSVLLALLVLAAAAVGPGALAVVVLVLAVVVLVDLGDALTKAATRPVLVAAAVPGLALPVVVAVTDVDGWTSLADFHAGMLLLTFTLVLIFGRRADVTVAVGVTALVGLVVGLGATSLLLLRELVDGFRWVAGVAVLVIAAELSYPAAVVFERQRRNRREDQRGDEGQEPGDSIVLAAAAVLLALAATALRQLWVPPYDLRAVAAAAAAVFVVRAVADDLARTLTGAETGSGQLTAAAGGILLAAPVVYVLARSAAV